ncbi:CDP-diacylglycerol--glycerol-3-phosphate 3-phosphatidyltransferase [Marinibaculum pumilum]|uniref:CDP-diacylglycerol--glycerol-3-phosphate 3-phosphatidyltransferase n=1 Tax=Marinibaculum pumilum TaxID=1766165 RepID=A0ABV7L5W3_9PROT
MRRHIPNLLTLARVLAVVPFCAAFWLPDPAAGWTALVLFAAAAVTDWFDGWLARRWQAQSDFGRWLDPIADKLLVAAALTMLLAKGQLGMASAIAVIIILGREILISGLREFLGQKQVVVAVTGVAKWKTAAQLVAIVLLLLAMTAAGAVLQPAALVLLWIAAALTAWSGADYLAKGLPHLR